MFLFIYRILSYFLYIISLLKEYGTGGLARDPFIRPNHTFVG